MCPFCRRIEQEFRKLNNVTIYLYPYPIEKRFPGTTELSKAIWCSIDRAKAWDDWMLKGQRPAAKGSCPNPVDEIEKIGSKLGIEITPTVVFADGAPMRGMITAADIERLIDQTPKP
jgi:thiol:disulfide interchange protein DsbC